MFIVRNEGLPGVSRVPDRFFLKADVPKTFSYGFYIFSNIFAQIGSASKKFVAYWDQYGFNFEKCDL